ncbi:helix-turn-helix domain-containing protein [Nonomuraea sp. NPDC046570]|uniref:TetR/AcrR family transcriptional regulator n=1 Tax=Nonomuraea sp. NPDC046570 TaxID=3155255 RepID=UPI0034001063
MSRPSGSAVARALLDAARELFAERGFHATAVNDITKRAGTSVGALYYHFESKDKVYHVLWDEYMRTQEQRTREAVTILREAGVTDSRKLFLAGTRAYLTSAWEHRDIVRLLGDGDSPPGFAAVAAKSGQVWTQMNAKLITLSDPVATQALVAIITGSVGAVCREVAGCAQREAAEELIAKSIEIYSTLLDNFPNS